MTAGTSGTDLLRRSLKASWLVALAVAVLVLPSHPEAAFSIVAGQLIAALNFFFLEKLVKLFTEGRVAAATAGGEPVTPERRARRDAAIFGWVALKLTLVYGGAFALVRVTPWTRLLPLGLGLSLPLAVLFLKSIMLALGKGPASLLRRATQTVASSGNAAKPAALLFTLGSLFLPAFARAAEEAERAAGAVHAAGAAHAAAAAHAEGGAQELPNWIVILHDFFPHNPFVHWLEANQILVFAWLGGLVFLGISWIAMRRPKPVPGHLQNAIEWMVESMEDICTGLLGKHVGRYFPFIGAIFFYILTINLLGILPGFKSATSSLDLTLALALITFVYVQFWGIRNLGILGYLDHLAGSPRDVIGFAMLPVMVPVHILGELAKPVSLSCRLFGNIFGEDTLIVVFVGATAMCLKASLVALALPPMLGISALFMLLQTLTSIVQALIFSLLATVYLYMMLPHEEHAHETTEHAHS